MSKDDDRRMHVARGVMTEASSIPITTAKEDIGSIAIKLKERHHHHTASTKHHDGESSRW